MDLLAGIFALMVAQNGDANFWNVLKDAYQ
jgi:hypothetical protein